MWGGKPNPNMMAQMQQQSSGIQHHPGRASGHMPVRVPPPPRVGGVVQVPQLRGQSSEQALGRQQKEMEMQERRAELQKKREEEHARRTEHAAAIVVRKVIQRIRVVQPEKLDEIRNELETTMHEQLEKMGSLAEKITQEAEKELIEAQARVDTLNAKRIEEEKQKAEEEAKKALEAQRATQLQKDVETLALDAETKVGYASAAETRLEEAKEAGSPDAILKAAHSLGELVEVAQTAIDDLTKSLNANLAEMEFTQESIAQLKKDFRKPQSKNAECKRSLAKITKTMKEAKEREGLRAAALDKLKRQKDAFFKYDSCGGGQLSRDDLRLFAKDEYGFEMEEAVIDRIHGKLKGKGVGVPFELFRRMRAMVAIERSVTKEREKLAQEERLKAELEATKTELKALFAEADKALEEAKAEAAEAEAAAKPLMLKTAAKMSAAEMKDHAAKVEELLSPGASALARARELAAAAAATMGEIAGSEEEVIAFKKQVTEDFAKRAKQVQAQLDKYTNTAKTSKQKVLRKEFAEMETFRFKFVKLAGEFMAAKSMDVTQLHAHAAKASGSSALSADDLVALGAELQEHAGDKLDEAGSNAYRSLFKLAAGESESLSQELFTELLQVSYTVAKPTMLTDGAAVDSKSKRRLEEAEVIHGLACPARQTASGVLRVRCKAARDDIEGWVSVAGNKGTTFLEPCSKYLICLKETVITAELEVSSETVKKLNKDELVEVLQFATKEPTCSVMRVKAKTIHGGVVGWVSIAGNAGTSFLGPC